MEHRWKAIPSEVDARVRRTMRASKDSHEMKPCEKLRREMFISL